MRTYLAIATALPLLALLVAGGAVDEAWHSRDVAQQVQVLTVEVGTLVETESALGRELALSYVSASRARA